LNTSRLTDGVVSKDVHWDGSIHDNSMVSGIGVWLVYGNGNWNNNYQSISFYSIRNFHGTDTAVTSWWTGQQGSKRH